MDIDKMDRYHINGICNMFNAMGTMCCKIEKLVDICAIDLSNPIWGIEMETQNGKYQLVLELKEVKK